MSRFSCPRAMLVALSLCFVASHASARLTEVLDKSATVDLPANLQLLVSGSKVASIMVKNEALGGTLALLAGASYDAKDDYEQLLASYKFSGLQIISSSQRGNTFRIETRTGAGPYDIRRVISALYVPQAPGAPQSTFTSVLDIPNTSWDRPSGKAIRAAAASFKPKAPVFVDREAPKIFLADPVRPVTAAATSYTLKGVAMDNVAPVALRVRIKAPKAKYGPLRTVKLPVSSSKTRQWTYRLPMQSAKGQWRVELRAVDAAGLSSSPVTATITRR